MTTCQLLRSASASPAFSSSLASSRDRTFFWRMLFPRFLFCRLLFQSFVFFMKEFAGETDGVDPGRRPAIDRGMQDCFGDIVSRQAVIDGDAKIGEQLLRPIQRDKEHDIHEASGPAVDPGAQPELSPNQFRQNLTSKYQRRVEVGVGILDIGLARQLLSESAATRVERGVDSRRARVLHRMSCKKLL